jgi:hypothetical protein
MAKKRDNHDMEHNSAGSNYERRIRREYNSIVREAAKMVNTAKLNREEEFHFRGNLSLNKKINKLLLSLNENVYAQTALAVTSEWDRAVEKNNEVAKNVFGSDLKNLPDAYMQVLLSPNESARQAFLSRKLDGLDLSDRVWRNTRQFKADLELALEVGISKGHSADYTARNIRQYLNEPDRLYRRVRDEKGQLRLSKAAKAYNPGRGVYRSSYKNAVRLVRNETNFAYEKSNETKRMRQDFVVGMRIQVSPSHDPKDDKGGVECIILQGNYPKDFDWHMKWHVNCKCVSFSILKTEEEIKEDIRRIMNGEEPLPAYTSINYVGDTPDHFRKYIQDNEEKWKNHKHQPKFIELNKRYVDTNKSS